MKFLKALTACALVMPLATQAAETVTIEVGYSPGGSYDAIARLVADHLGDHLDGHPTVVVENVPGAGSLKLAKMVIQDGSGARIATVSSALALRPIFEPDETDFDPRKAQYLASLSNGASYCVAHPDSGITSLQEFLDDPDAKAGASGKGSTTYTYPAAIKAALGGKFQVVTGFKGGAEIGLAMERGEIQVRCGIGQASLQPGTPGEGFVVIAELSPEPRHEFEGVDFALDFAPSENREALKLVFSSGAVHHPFLVGPDVPAERVEELRAAFTALAEDPAFLADDETRRTFTHITPGAEVEALIDGFLAAPEAVQAQARAFVE